MATEFDEEQKLDPSTNCVGQHCMRTYTTRTRCSIRSGLVRMQPSVQTKKKHRYHRVRSPPSTLRFIHLCEHTSYLLNLKTKPAKQKTEFNHEQKLESATTASNTAAEDAPECPNEGKKAPISVSLFSYIYTKIHTSIGACSLPLKLVKRRCHRHGLPWRLSLQGRNPQDQEYGDRV